MSDVGYLIQVWKGGRVIRINRPPGQLDNNRKHAEKELDNLLLMPGENAILLAINIKNELIIGETSLINPSPSRERGRC